MAKCLKFFNFRFIELQKLIKSAKYIGISSPLTKFWAANLFIYSFFYPALRLAFEKERVIQICERFCERFIKTPLPPGSVSFPNLAKNKIILKNNQEWAIFIEIHLRDTYHKDILKEGMNIIDIGAHIGIYTVLAAEKIGDTGKVVAIEPALKNYKSLLENINLNNFKNVIPVNIALSDHGGLGKLYLNPRPACHSLLSTENDKISSFDEIELKTLDNLLEELNIKKIDIIKIDTEGSEIPILRGAEKTLKNNPEVKIAVASYHYPGETEEVQKFLQKSGFKTKISHSNIVTTI